MIKRVSGVLFIMAAVLIIAPSAFAHCQVPCGIYHDEMRFEMFDEHITTIEKSMNEIIRLSNEEEKNYNQIVRWVTNKDLHANEIEEIVSYYFLDQRIKPVEDENSPDYGPYVDKLTLLHQITVYAMKTKQGTDLANVEKLRSLVAQFHEVYFGPDAGNKSEAEGKKK